MPTVKIYAGGNHAAYKKDDDYGVVHAAAAGQGDTSGVGQYYWAPGADDYTIQREANSLDARSLPAGATITAVTFNFQLDNNYSDTDFDMVIQQMPSDVDVVALTRYNRDNFSGDGGSLNTAGISGLVTITLNATGISWISLSEVTKIGVRSSRDIAQTIPTGLEYITYSGVPYYLITYDVAAVTTQAASSIGVDHAKGNGTSTGNDATERGFEVKLAFSGTLYEYVQRHAAGFSTGTVTFSGGVWSGDIVKTVTEEGTFVAESFTGDLGRFPIAVFSDRLFAGETYDYRAYAIIDGTTYHGGWVEFTTATYPVGGGPDDQIPIDDIIPSQPYVEPIVPFEPLEEVIDIIGEFPELELPAWEFPEFDYPEMPSYDGSWLGWFYYRKAYTKKDLEELRKKCRIFQDNSVEYALVINHNSRVLQQFLNTMSTYLGADEHNTFRPIIPTQHLNELARKPLDVMDFKKMINNFVSNSIDNANNVNNNFRLIRDGLSDYTDEGFISISITTKVVNDNNPDVDRLKKVVDRLNKEMANNYMTINHNLHVLREILI